MRVLVVTPWFPSAAAPNSGIFNLRDARLIAHDHQVTVLHLIHPNLLRENEPDLPSMHVVRIPFGFDHPTTILSAARKIASYAKQFDVLHSMAFSALLPVRLSRSRVPWMHTEHYSQLVTPPASRRMAATLSILKRLFKHPSEVIAVSNSLAKVINRHRVTPATVIGNEVMLPSELRPSHREEAIQGQRLHMIGIGGLIGRKGPLEAWETTLELRRRGIDARLIWVGTGELESRLREAAAEADADKYLTLTGHLEPEDLSKELGAADLLLLPVETETFGVAIAEALAHGLPVVTTGTGGHVEFLPERASRLVPERQAPLLADAVQELLIDPELWSRQRISDYAADRFSAEVRLAAYRAVYRKALESKDSSR